MKAIEAIKLSLQNKARMQKTAEKKAKKAQKAAIKNEKEERKEFFANLLKYANEVIISATEEGKTETTFAMWPGGDSPVAAESQIDNHGYSDLIKKVERKLRDDGYKVEHVLTSSEHYVSYDTSDEKYNTYHAEIKVSWE